MYKLVASLVLNVFFLSPALADEKNLSIPRKEDADCALFEDECHVLKSILKIKLEKETIFWDANNIRIYSWRPLAKVVCGINYLVEPERPKNPVPRCLANECFVVEKYMIESPDFLYLKKLLAVDFGYQLMRVLS